MQAGLTLSDVHGLLQVVKWRNNTSPQGLVLTHEQWAELEVSVLTSQPYALAPPGTTLESGWTLMGVPVHMLELWEEAPPGCLDMRWLTYEEGESGDG